MSKQTPAKDKEHKSPDNQELTDGMKITILVCILYHALLIVHMVIY